MTMPSPETREREKDKLYVTDAELIRRLGVPPRVAKPAIRFLEEKQGFPKKQKMWGDRRYWPAIEAYLAKHNGLTMGSHSQGERHG